MPASPRDENAPRILHAAPLTRAAFAPFGDVVGLDGSETNGRAINGGTSTRYDDIVRIETSANGGHTRASLVRAAPVKLPASIAMLERHPKGSQLFLPLGTIRFLVVVGSGGPDGSPPKLSAFVTDGRQGINYRPGVWHHPLLSLEAGNFLVVDRTPERDNIEEFRIDHEYSVRLEAGLQGE